MVDVDRERGLGYGGWEGVSDNAATYADSSCAQNRIYLLVEAPGLHAGRLGLVDKRELGSCDEPLDLQDLDRVVVGGLDQLLGGVRVLLGPGLELLGVLVRDARRSGGRQDMDAQVVRGGDPPGGAIDPAQPADLPRGQVLLCALLGAGERVLVGVRAERVVHDVGRPGGVGALDKGAANAGRVPKRLLQHELQVVTTRRPVARVARWVRRCRRRRSPGPVRPEHWTTSKESCLGWCPQDPPGRPARPPGAEPTSPAGAGSGAGLKLPGVCYLA